jgi:hypothetical protein
MIILTKQFTHLAPVVQDESNATMKHIRTRNNNNKAPRWPFLYLVALIALESSSLPQTAQAYDSLLDYYDENNFDNDFFDVEAFFDFDYYGDDGDDEEEENGLGITDPTLSPTADVITTPSPTPIADSLTPSPTLAAAFAAGTPPPTTATAPREGDNVGETTNPTLSPTADIITTPSPTAITAILTPSPTVAGAAASGAPPTTTTPAETAPPTTMTSANRTKSMIPTAAPSIINVTLNSSENGPPPTFSTPGIPSDVPSDAPSDAPSDVPSDAPSSFSLNGGSGSE